MHGYDIGGMQHVPPLIIGQSHTDTLGHHPDSTDSYVTYLESDESIQASP